MPGSPAVAAARDAFTDGMDAFQSPAAPRIQRTHTNLAASRPTHLGLPSGPGAEQFRQGSFRRGSGAHRATPPSSTVHTSEAPPSSGRRASTSHGTTPASSQHRHRRLLGTPLSREGSPSPPTFHGFSDCFTTSSEEEGDEEQLLYPLSAQRLHSSPPSPLLGAERKSLLDRVQQLSAREAEAAAALAQSRAVNDSLRSQLGQAQGVAREALAARRASREALADMSAEHARLAAQYTAARREVVELRAALQEERIEGQARVEQLEALLAAAEAAAAGNSPSPPVRRRSAPPGAAAPSPQAAAASSPAHWDSERAELLGLLQTLQQQLDAHARQQSSQRTPLRRPTSGAPRPAAAARTPPPQPPASAASTPASAASSTPLHTRFSVPPSPFPSPPPAPPAASWTPHPPEPVPSGLRFESSYESSAVSEDWVAHDVHAAPAVNAHQLPKPAAASPAQGSVHAHAQSGRPCSHQRVSPMAASQPERPVGGPTADSAARRPVKQQQQPVGQVAPDARQLKASGDALARRRQHAAAIEQYSAALAAAERAQDGAMAAAVLCSRAAMLHSCHRFLEAAADCCRAERADPRCVLSVDLRAEALTQMGAHALAAEDLDKLRRLTGGTAGALTRNPALQARVQAVRRCVAREAPPNHYAVLAVSPSASPAEVKAAYRALALRLHPDKAAEAVGAEAASALFSLLSAAHAALSDPASRRAYDLLLLRQKYWGGTSPVREGGNRGAWTSTAAYW